MKVTYLRGATVILEMDDNVRILCDPWLVDGAYYGAWAHFPVWTEDDWQKCKDIDYIYVSHIHPDHFDVPTMLRLKQLWGNKQPTVLIADYPANFLRKRINELGFVVFEFGHGHRFQFGDSHVRFFLADGCDPAACGAFYGCTNLNWQLDSMAVFHDKRHTIVNVNDCPFPLSHKLCGQIALQYPQIDLAMVAYAGGGPWPQCFVMPEADKRKAAKAKQKMFLDRMVQFTKALGAKRVLPYAGDYVLCGSLAGRNEFRGIPHIAHVHSNTRFQDVDTLYLLPGQEQDLDSPLVQWPHPSEWELQQAMPELAKRKLDYEDDPDEGPEEVLWKAALHRFWLKAEELGMQCRAVASINGRKILPDATDEGAGSVAITVDDRLLKRLLSGPSHAHWNNAEIGSHLTIERTGPYEPGLYHLLSYLHA